MPTKPLGITKLSRIPRFEKAYKKLDPRIKDEADDALRDLVKPEIPAGRRLEKLGGYNNPSIYSIRVNKNYRLTFHLDGKTAILRNIDTHDRLYQGP